MEVNLRHLNLNFKHRFTSTISQEMLKKDMGRQKICFLKVADKHESKSQSFEHHVMSL